MEAPTDEMPFDKALTELERIVSRLEAGEIPLEDALAAFEQGVGLVRVLSRRLTEAESRVEVLTREADGELRLTPAGDELGN